MRAAPHTALPTPWELGALLLLQVESLEGLCGTGTSQPVLGSALCSQVLPLT